MLLLDFIRTCILQPLVSLTIVVGVGQIIATIYCCVQDRKNNFGLDKITEGYVAFFIFIQPDVESKLFTKGHMKWMQCKYMILFFCWKCDENNSWLWMGNIYLAVERDDRLLGLVRLPLNRASRCRMHPGAPICIS